MIDTLFYITMTLFLLVCLLLIMVILIQKGRGGGLSGAFGGAGGNTAFGSKTGDVLTWATSIIFGVFLLLAIALNLLANKRNDEALSQASIGAAAAVQEPPAAPIEPTPSPAPTPAPMAVPQSAPSTMPTSQP